MKSNKKKDDDDVSRAHNVIRILKKCKALENETKT